MNSCLLEVAVDGISADKLEHELRRATPPVVGRIDQDRVLLDLRTVAPDEDQRLTEVLLGLS